MSNGKASILVVDDTPDNLRLLSALLSAEGYMVRKALNGKIALTTIQRTPPELILLDITMPDLNGYEICEALKADELTQEIPVIFISALDDALDKVKAFAVGGSDYITKPFQAAEVLARVAHQLTIRRLQQQLQAQNALLRQEQAESERLLLNILPACVAEQLKAGMSTTQQFEEASFLFADIVSFSYHSATMPPQEVVNLLNRVFTRFDRLTQQFGLEKIRTIGDAYFVAGGLPVPRPDHAEAIAKMALAMQAAIAQFLWPNGEPLQLRIGINTGGPVVAAAIGIHKFAYDVWGDSVNIASRMESHGQPGRIQVTAATYDRLQHHFRFEKRGAIAVKGRGEMIAYWLLGKLD